MRICRPILAATLCLVVGAPAMHAQQGAACSAEEHRQFDFWIGEWTVTSVTNGNLAGTNRIESILGGCVLRESYTTPSGYAGHSYNAYDRQTGQWHQTWVDNQGLVLKIDGGLEDGRMVLSGKGVNAAGAAVVHRITWTPQEDGAVQQTWESSADDGETWSVVFDGMYRKSGG